MEGQNFVFKGDNNAFIDGYRPAPGEMEGSLWFSIPGLGSWLTWLREPWPLALLSLVSAAGIVGGWGPAARGPRRRAVAPGRRAERKTA